MNIAVKNLDERFYHQLEENVKGKRFTSAHLTLNVNIYVLLRHQGDPTVNEAPASMM